METIVSSSMEWSKIPWKITARALEKLTVLLFVCLSDQKFWSAFILFNTMFIVK